MQLTHRVCRVCDSLQPIDGHWRGLSLYREALLLSDVLEDLLRIPEKFNEPTTALACGQMHALVLVERFLHDGSFDAFTPITASPTE